MVESNQETSQIKDNTWYVCIDRTCGAGIYYSFIGVGGESYRGFAGLLKEHGGEVAAEQFGVSDAVVNRITGFDESGRHTGKSPLKELVDGFNADKVQNVKEALAALCCDS